MDCDHVDFRVVAAVLYGLFRLVVFIGKQAKKAAAAKAEQEGAPKAPAPAAAPAAGPEAMPEVLRNYLEKLGIKVVEQQPPQEEIDLESAAYEDSDLETNEAEDSDLESTAAEDSDLEDLSAESVTDEPEGAVDERDFEQAKRWTPVTAPTWTPLAAPARTWIAPSAPPTGRAPDSPRTLVRDALVLATLLKPRRR